MDHFLSGIVVGFAVAAPVGPVGLLCIRRSVIDGHLVGFVTGLGAAVADAIFGLIAAIGLASVMAFLTSHTTELQLAGGVLMLVVGIATMRLKPPVRTTGPVHARNLHTAFGSTVAITLANPMTVMGFVAIFTGFGVGLTTREPGPLAWLVLGVFLGSAAWWLLLSMAASWLSKHISDGGLRLINVVTGALIVVFGLWQLLRLLLRG